MLDRPVFPRGIHRLENQQQRPRPLCVELALQLAEAFDAARQALRAARLRLDPSRVVGIDVLQPEFPPVGNRERLDTPEKNWKFSATDVLERGRWDDYMAAYEDMIQHTATAVAPWYVVPADHKWFTRLVVAEAVADSLAALDLQIPKLDRAKRKELEVAREQLERER